MNEEPVVVTQAAREAAASLAEAMPHYQGGNFPYYARSGEYDETPLVQAFARFEAETIERCCQIAEEEHLCRTSQK